MLRKICIPSFDAFSFNVVFPDERTAVIREALALEAVAISLEALTDTTAFWEVSPRESAAAEAEAEAEAGAGAAAAAAAAAVLDRIESLEAAEFLYLHSAIKPYEKEKR
jgi:hypothetical protein